MRSCITRRRQRERGRSSLQKGRFFLTRTGGLWGEGFSRKTGGLRKAIQRKLREEIGLVIAIDAIPSIPEPPNYFQWAEDGSTVLAPLFLIRISEEDFWRMVKNILNSPEFSDIQSLDPLQVWESDEYHPALLDGVGALLEQLTR